LSLLDSLTSFAFESVIDDKSEDVKILEQEDGSMHFNPESSLEQMQSTSIPKFMEEENSVESEGSITSDEESEGFEDDLSSEKSEEKDVQVHFFHVVLLIALFLRLLKQHHKMKMKVTNFSCNYSVWERR
jgi:hypothetical protein